MTKISHSQIQKFLQCSESYRLHYIENLRPIKTNSAFLWGSAVDSALNELLKTKMDPKPEVILNPMDVFNAQWKESKINDKVVELATSELIEYSRKDLDLDIFDFETFEKLHKAYPDDNPSDFVKYLIELRYDSENKKDRYDMLTSEERIAYNYAAWLSLGLKAKYIIEAYEKEILPQIKRVIAIQKAVELENDLGDSVIGAIDFIAELDDGKTYIIDNKSTSSFSYYPQGSVESSEQLALYAYSENTENAAYIVYLKDVKRDKRIKGSKHTAKIRVMKGTIDTNYQLAILSNFDIINKEIKDGLFNKLDDSSKCYFYNKLCPYFNKCWNNSDEGLIQKPRYDKSKT